jgi:tRNA(fMet)-specific endonuclease VapC
MMLILDTDHLTIIQRQSEPAYSSLLARLREASSSEICTTIVNFEEQMRGWLAVIGRFRRAQQEVTAYRQLHALLSFFAEVSVLDFDGTAAEQFMQLRRSRVRIGSMDLKIASIALSRRAILLSRNLSDFRRVPGLQVEDWTQ